MYRGTSLIRNRTPLKPYSRSMPRALWPRPCGDPRGGGCFILARYPSTSVAQMPFHWKRQRDVYPTNTATRYRGTSLIRNFLRTPWQAYACGPVVVLRRGAFSYERGRPMPVALWWSLEGGRFHMSEVPLYAPAPRLCPNRTTTSIRHRDCATLNECTTSAR